MEGIHQQMGNVWLPNRAFSQYKLIAYFLILDSRWPAAHMCIVDKFELKRIAATVCTVLASYSTSLWREEIAKDNLGAMNKYWDESTTHTTHTNHKHIQLMMSGTFKKETGIKYFCQPLAMYTNREQDVGVWFSRLTTIRNQRVLPRVQCFWDTRGNVFQLLK